MNTTLVRTQLDNFETSLRNLKFSYNRAMAVLEDKQKIGFLLQDSSRVLDDIRTRKNELSILYRIVGKEEVDYKKRRVSYIDGSITSRLKYIFPKHNLRAETDCDFKRQQTNLRLYLVDAKGNKRPPFVTEGKCAQQLIRYTVAESILELLGKKTIYMDEAFSNSDPDNLIKIQSLLEKSTENGFQILLISQSSLLYNDIARCEIYLKSDANTQITEVKYAHFGKEE